MVHLHDYVHRVALTGSGFQFSVAQWGNLIRTHGYVMSRCRKLALPLDGAPALDPGPALKGLGVGDRKVSFGSLEFRTQQRSPPPLGAEYL